MKQGLIQKEMTEKECYENIKRLHKEHPDIIMNPDEWLKKHREWKKNIKEKGE